jgi:hypothetical protein
MTVDNCKVCKFYLGHDIGSCRRYPDYKTRSQNEWCGEFAKKLSEGEAVAETLPKTNLLGVFSAMGMEEVTMPTPKRGRPRK